MIGQIILVVVGCLLAILLMWAASEKVLGEALFALALIGGVIGCNQTDWWQDHVKTEAIADAARAKAEATPHVIREADGCKVYAFKAGEKWHYFTRCPATTTTERHYNEPCGKNCNRDAQETIVTENK